MKDLLKFITCGSVDDGKSTLIGHMLYDAKLLFADQEKALELDSRIGSREGAIDYSLLLDGLMAEREQGITIDVAYRYFTTDNRSFIVADTPGHEEYTRNMAVGASFADLAVILADAAQGILLQTKRHARICSMIGIRHFVFAINKMDLVRYDQKQFDKICREITQLLHTFDYASLAVIPVSATEGDNVTNKSPNMPWYKGVALLPYLEEVDVSCPAHEEGFIMPVQRVARPNHTFRGFQGQIVAGTVHVGDEVKVLPSRETAYVKDLLVGSLRQEEACAGQPITVQLDHEMDVSRGCVLTAHRECTVSNLFTANLLWLEDEELMAGKSYYLKLGTMMIPAVVIRIKYRMDINTEIHEAADVIYKNEMTVCDISVSEKIVFDSFVNQRALGSFILINRVSNQTSACGVVRHSLRRADNIIWQETDITRQLRSQQKGQKPVTIWFTGLSGSGKSTLANAVEKCLFAKGRHTMLLDGDNIRMGLNKNLGFKENDRIENIRRIAEVSKLMNDAGLIVLAAFISPFARDREMARQTIGAENFIEVYVKASLEVCEQRDVKGLYKKARDGEIPNFTGISSAYDVPEHPQLVVDTVHHPLDECVEQIMQFIERTFV